MYSDFYGFTGRPFPLTADPAVHFASLSHGRAGSDIIGGLEQGEGFVVLTGDVGAGKTALVGHIMTTIDPQQVTVAHMVSGHFAAAHRADGHRSFGQTIPAVARAFGLATPAVPVLTAETRSAFMLDANLAFLRDEARAGRRCLLVVDEAEALPNAALEALRLLSIFRFDDRPLLQILLVGNRELRARLQSDPDLELLRQRVIVAHHLEPLESGEVEHYIHHRLKWVGWNGNPTFAPQIHADIFTATGGVPGRINRLVDRLLRVGAAQHKAHIDAAMLSQAVAEWTRPAPDEDEKGVSAEPRTRLDAALGRCQDQITELQQTVIDLSETREASHRQDDAALQERLGSLESRLIEQERTLRHTLTMLIEWIERDEAHGVAA